MRKVVEWVVYPKTNNEKVLIQCDKRIAEVNLQSGTAKLSHPKSGNSFAALIFGTSEVHVPADVLGKLKSIPVNPTKQIVIT